MNLIHFLFTPLVQRRRRPTEQIYQHTHTQLDAKMDVHVMVNALWTMANINVFASKAGPDSIARFNWK